MFFIKFSKTIANTNDSGPMPSFYTMFCYVTLGAPFGTLRKYCKYHASGLSGVFRDPLGHSWCILGSPGLSLESLWGLPGHSPEPL